jgi:small subunit ribosomal protein S17
MDEKARPVRRTVIGTVVSTKMSKTICVERERRFMHPLYGKIVKRHKVLKAHDERELAMEGDRVEIMATRPISKTKCWRLVRVLASEGAEVEAAAPEEILAEEGAGEAVSPRSADAGTAED